MITGAFAAFAEQQQGPDYGVGVPGWGLRLTTVADWQTLSPVTCVGAGVTAIADASGNVTCDVQVPATPGDYYFTVLVGGSLKFEDGHIKVN